MVWGITAPGINKAPNQSFQWVVMMDIVMGETKPRRPAWMIPSHPKTQPNPRPFRPTYTQRTDDGAAHGDAPQHDVKDGQRQLALGQADHDNRAAAACDADGRLEGAHRGGQAQHGVGPALRGRRELGHELRVERLEALLGAQLGAEVLPYGGCLLCGGGGEGWVFRWPRGWSAAVIGINE